MCVVGVVLFIKLSEHKLIYIVAIVAAGALRQVHLLRKVIINLNEIALAYYLYKHVCVRVRAGL